MEALSNKGFSSCQPNLMNTKILNENASQASDFLKRQDLVLLDPGIFVQGHTVRTTEIAPIGYGDP